MGRKREVRTEGQWARRTESVPALLQSLKEITASFLSLRSHAGASADPNPTLRYSVLGWAGGSGGKGFVQA